MITVHVNSMSKEIIVTDINIDKIITYSDDEIVTSGGRFSVEETRKEINDMIYAARCARYETLAQELRNMGVGV